MNVRTIQQNLRCILAENKGYIFLSSIFSLTLVLLVLSPGNLYAWGFLGVLLLRIICLQNKSILLVAGILAALTAILAFAHVQSNTTYLDGGERGLEMRISPKDIKVDGNLLSGTATILLPAETERIAFFYTLKKEAEKSYWESLQTPVITQVELALTKPEGARNRHQFDYQKYLYRQRVHWTANLSVVHVIEAEEGLFPWLEKNRQRLLQQLQSSLPEGKLAEYVMAMLFNQTKFIDAEVMEAYRQIGVIHLFSISGMHIQFLLTMISFLLLRLGITKETSRPILFLVILAYGLFLGRGVGIFRAVFTNCLLLLAQMGKRKLAVKDAFGLTLLVALWRNPYLVYSIAFQLSYGLSGVLYFVGSALKKKRIPSWLQPVILSFIMTSVSFPVLSYHYFEVSWLSMFANIFFSFFFAGCFFPVFWLIAVFALFRAPFWLFIIPQTFFERALLLLERVSEILAMQNEFLLITGRPAFLFYLLLFGCIIKFLIALEEDKGQKPAVLLLLASFACFYFLPLLNPTGKVIHLDVGQGDAVLLISPFQKDVVLLDTGGKMAFMLEETWQLRSNQSSHAKNLVASLKAEGVRKLDAVILSHADQDHIGNFSYLANKIQIDRVWVAGGMENTAAWKEKLAEVHQLDFVVEPVISPARIKEGTVQFEVMSPTREGTGTNADSLVLAAQIGGHRWLFTGDLEEEGERAIMRRYPGLRIDFLNISHHGSLTSTSAEFLDYLQPKGAFISVGKKNSYGHPDLEVLKRLNERGIVTFRTDQHGAIHFLYWGQKQSIETMLQ